MHITAYCPECQSRYQLHPDLRGRKMRCPNDRCQTVFVVREAGSGNGDEAPTVAAPALPPEFDWRATPPPVQAPAREKVPAVEPVGAPPVGKLVAPPRRPEPPPPVQAPPPPRTRTWEEPPPVRRRWGLIVAAGLGFVAVAAAVYGGVFVVRSLARDEDTRRAEAEADYQGGVFGRAGKRYGDLATKYGNSPRAAEYRFLADLSSLRDFATSNPTEAVRLAEAFDTKYEARDPQLKAHRDDVAAAIAAVAAGIVDAAQAIAQAGDPATADLFKQAQKALDLLRRFPPKDSTRLPDLQARLDRAAEAFARAVDRRKAIDEVLALLRQARPDIPGARRLAMLRQVGSDVQVVAALRDAEGRLREVVSYQVLNKPPQIDGPPVGPPGLLIDTARVNGHRPAAADTVVLAVARGLLYALDGRDGRRVWACRVGLDVGELPTRVPARGDAPELVVVVSAEPAALTARDVRTGAVAWHQPLEAPCLGRPVRGDADRLFVPTAGAEGFVYDLDARTGVIRGRFETHQQLAAGGAFDPATQRLYVPAHGQDVYVFNYDGPPKCDGLLPTGHAAGSLRGEPIVVTGEEGIDVPRYLVLGEADGLGAMTLTAFRLLSNVTDPPPTAAVSLAGWSWFPPYHDPETIALVTDAGAIGLFGIQQAGNESDPALFSLVGEAVSAAGRGSARPARGQLVHAEEYGFWVLADGVLRHWRLGLTRHEGRKLVPAWGRGVPLGAPLHAAQVSADRRTLFVVTQTDSPPAYRATAVDAQSGEIVWQRPLGIAPQGDPVRLGDAVVVLDHSGAVYRFDPDQHPAASADPWQARGKEIAQPVADLAGMPDLLPAGDGQSAWVVLARPDGDGYRLTLRRIGADGAVASGSVTVPAPLAGAPAVGPGVIVLPLANGQLCRVTLDAENPGATIGPDWRTPGSPADARGQVVWWKGDEYLVGNGGRRLTRLTWPAAGQYSLDNQSSLDLPRRLVGTPVRLPDGRAVMADAGGTVTLLGGDRPTPGRSWQVGTVTAGPWAVGDRIALAVDRRKLVWLNPDADAPAWVYTTDGDGIESPPRLVDGRLIVADLRGRFVALDPATGQATGRYDVTAEAAPASAVTPFGPGRLFAPLTDGAALLLPLTDLIASEPRTK